MIETHFNTKEDDSLEQRSECITLNEGHYHFELSLLILSNSSKSVQFSIYFTKKGLQECTQTPRYQKALSKFTYHEPLNFNINEPKRNYTYCVVAKRLMENSKKGFDRCAIRDYFWKNQKEKLKSRNSFFSIKNPISLKAALNHAHEEIIEESTYLATCSVTLSRILDFLENDQDYIIGTFAIDDNPTVDHVKYEKYAWKIVEYPLVSIRAVVPKRFSFVLNSSAIFYHDFNLSEPYETMELDIIPVHFCIRHLVMTQHKPSHFIPVQVSLLSNSGELLDKFMLKKYEYLNLSQYPSISSLEPGKSCYDGFKLQFNHKVSESSTAVAIAISVAHDESLLPIVSKAPKSFLKVKMEQLSEKHFEIFWAVLWDSTDASFMSKFEYKMLVWIISEYREASTKSGVFSSELLQKLSANLTINVQSNQMVNVSTSNSSSVTVRPFVKRYCIFTDVDVAENVKALYENTTIAKVNSILVWVAVREIAYGHHWIFFEELRIPLANSTT